MATTKATFRPRAQAPASRPRKTVEAADIDQTVAANRAAAGYGGGDLGGDLGGDEERVEVDVPHAFRLTDDSHVVHEYSAGRQKMPRSHADHQYSKANGVTPTDN